MTVEIDESTGLPVLPDGQFWRVAARGETSLVLQLRKATWYGSRVMSSEMIYPDMVWVLGSVKTQLSNEATKIVTQRGSRRFIGDYPPKRLRS